jgi:hypothetical protein
MSLTITKVLPPTITCIGGTSVTIYGDNFGCVRTVSFNGKSALCFKIISIHQIIAWTPYKLVSGSNVSIKLTTIANATIVVNGLLKTINTIPHVCLDTTNTHTVDDKATWFNPFCYTMKGYTRTLEALNILPLGTMKDRYHWLSLYHVPTCISAYLIEENQSQWTEWNEMKIMIKLPRVLEIIVLEYLYRPSETICNIL